MHKDAAGCDDGDTSGRITLSTMKTSRKVLLLAMNAIPLLQVILTLVLMGLYWSRPWLCLAAVITTVYLLPPLISRSLLLAMPITRREIQIGSRDFFVWWFALNLQVLYSRFPIFEELLRIVPACYSMWLRLWGAKVGRLTYWAAGVQVLDRPWLEIGDQVIFGAGVRLAGHLIVPDRRGHLELLLAPIRIGSRVTVGGYSVLAAGSEIAAEQSTRAFLVLPPFNRLEDGRRIKPGPAYSADVGCESCAIVHDL